MSDLAESLHNLIDAECTRMHQVLDELLARHAPAPSRGRICIDPGHGGEDAGAVVGEVREADLVLEYAHELSRILKARGHFTKMTRHSDMFIPLADRSAVANTMAGDCFVSLHANFSANAGADGAWIIHAENSGLGKQLAQDIFARLEEVPGIADEDPDAEVYADRTPWVGGRRLAVLRKTFAPAVLVELGFLSNKGDLAQLLNVDARARVCRALADGIESWMRRRVN